MATGAEAAMPECLTSISKPAVTAQRLEKLEAELEQLAPLPPVGDGLRRVAAIDLGTNSTHLLIAAVDPALRSFTVLLAEKSTTRLGERDPDSGALSQEAIDRTRLALRHCRDLASSHGVEEIVCVATSAMREAPNGLAFLAELRQELGINAEVISGTEEARLIYLGVLSGMEFGERPHTILDIGGGSTELILADATEARALTSVRVGAVRLQRDFVRREPLETKRVDFLRAFIQGSLEPSVEKVMRRLEPGEQPRLVATSGTAMAVAALLAAESPRSSPRLHGMLVRRAELDALVEKVLPLTPQQRRSLPGINERRSEILVPGLLVLQTALDLLKAEEFVISERALREGLIIDWMLRHDLIVDRFAYQSEIRRRTVLHQAHKFGVDVPRAERIAGHALSLFDQTRGSFHQSPQETRQLLWAAALLHSSGLHINTSGYHKHSWYLIHNGDLLGYTQSEQLLVAALARYHRRSLPKKRHESWLLLDRDQRRLLESLSLLLRLAVAMDRRPQMVISELQASCVGRSLWLQLLPVNSEDDLSLELWSLETCSQAINEASGYNLRCSLLKAEERAQLLAA
jgi:exopolyphosphatase/guanosine-5'-triphosphate,3'-diphosphate pyrophosphatase